jgi:hypothetical protein
MTTSVNPSEFRARVKDAHEAGIIIGDGHTLFAPEHYAPHFTAEELYEAGLIRNHRSDGSPKGSIYANDGSVVESVKAVYNLDFLYWLAYGVSDDVKVTAMGRGSQAQQLVDCIVTALS